jgi:hypothetical protein
MKLTTDINIAKSPFDVSHCQNVLLLGSCFSQNIGERLTISGFQTKINPFGTIYNPFSIAEALNYITFKQNFNRQEVIQSGDVYKIISCHGDVFGYSQNEAINEAKKRQQAANDFLQSKSVIIITLGTAWLYSFIPSGRPLANCHKIDSKLISRRLMTIDEIIQTLYQSLENLRQSFETDIIFTISPVRHLREGLRDNLLSKSILHLAIEEVCNNFPAVYFPAYEIMIDQLRDYRYYADDLIHPNSLAVSILWDKFAATFLEPSTQSLCEKYEQLWTMKQHRPLYPQSNQYQQHLNRIGLLEDELKLLRNKH